MELKRNLKYPGMLLILFCVFIAACKNEKAAVSSEKYTCPMHPQVIKDQPGTCPVCGMDLVKVNSSENKNEVSLSESQIQLANIKTLAVGQNSFKTSKILNARLVADPAFANSITSRYSGRIEKLFIKETGRLVKKGEPLFRIYSEELQVLQRDYQLQVKQAAAFPGEKIYLAMKEAAKNKLLLFGYSNKAIKDLELNGKMPPEVTVYSTASGIVNEILVSEGEYVTEGSPVISLENYHQLWVEADVYPDEAGLVKAGQPVRIAIGGVPELDQDSKIIFISPQLDPSTQILKIRASVKSRGKLQSGMQATVLLPSADFHNAVTLPLDAVLRDENGTHVWIKTGEGTFEPRMVTTGAEDEQQVIITSGLEDATEVVIGGAYLLYSEFILKKGADPMAKQHTHNSH